MSDEWMKLGELVQAGLFVFSFIAVIMAVIQSTDILVDYFGQAGIVIGWLLVAGTCILLIQFVGYAMEETSEQEESEEE